MLRHGEQKMQVSPSLRSQEVHHIHEALPKPNGTSTVILSMPDTPYNAGFTPILPTNVPPGVEAKLSLQAPCCPLLQDLETSMAARP